jgi:hypothetical protein
MTDPAKNAGKWLLVFCLTLTVSFSTAVVVEVVGTVIGLGALVYDWEKGCERNGVKPGDCRMDFRGLLGG